MEITEISYKRKVSDLNYGNQEVGICAQLEDGDSLAATFYSLKTFVDIKLGVATLPTDKERQQARQLAEKIRFIRLHPENPLETNIITEDCDCAITILNSIQKLNMAKPLLEKTFLRQPDFWDIDSDLAILKNYINENKS